MNETKPPSEGMTAKRLAELDDMRAFCYADRVEIMSELRRLRAENDSLRGEREPVKVNIGTSVLTKDLVWCGGCKRGISVNGRWLHCPGCGRPIDQESYRIATEAAKTNGESLYFDADTINAVIERDAAIAERDAALETIREWEPLLAKAQRVLNEAVDKIESGWSDCDDTEREIEAALDKLKEQRG